ncbi:MULTISPECIES: GPO family capsid scaffolding protein [Pseudomonas]|uniref:GPO family capsid scaffolding protein n=1 Tax=Pseudomonas TaxID=286 RepID=UPI0002EDE56C|nr:MULTISPECIES: GPO family capsid scaffolding protein [Pseudomonas]MDC7830293.1 GPO family capsid scaffolding protein [Pseudomonas benzopyrenica]
MADPKTPKLRSPFFRVAVEGATSDGRQIERSQIEQMAASYDPKTYGARIWMEHIRSSLADSPFRAYGDVIAVKAEEVEINGQKKLALFAQIEPTADLVALNKAKQKIYTSVEISPKFADTGAAYLVGLGITDSPASLGTDVLSFAAANPAANPYASRKLHADNLFTVADETVLTFAEVEDKPGLGAKLFAKVQELLKGKDAHIDGEFAQIGAAVTAVAEHVREQDSRFTNAETAFAELAGKHAQLQTDFTALQVQLSQTQDPNQTKRPPVTGGDGQNLTDC